MTGGVAAQCPARALRQIAFDIPQLFGKLELGIDPGLAGMVCDLTNRCATGSSGFRSAR
jgi:hypothetical protein